MEPRSSGIQVGGLFANRYRVERMIGSGGMGEVYLATDTMLAGERVALKILYSQHCRDERQIKRFFREVQLTRKINHPAVVRTFDVGSHGDRLYMSMEYLEGIALKDRIEQGPIDTEEICQIIRGIAQGLEAIHTAGVIHRDLKPANIMILPDGSVKIADFGIARMGGTQNSNTKDDEIVGSAPYMAPELWMGKEVAAAADIYALGVITYELFTGILPFDGDNPAELMCKHIENTPLSPMEVSDNVPHWAHSLIIKMLAKQPELRPQTGGEILAAIERGLVDTNLSLIPEQVDVSEVYLPEKSAGIGAEPAIFEPPAITLPPIVSLANHSSGAAQKPLSIDNWSPHDARPLGDFGFNTAGAQLAAKVQRATFQGEQEDPLVSILWALGLPLAVFALLWGLSSPVSFLSLLTTNLSQQLGYPNFGAVIATLLRCSLFALPPLLIVLSRGKVKAAIRAGTRSALAIIAIGFGLAMSCNLQLDLSPWGFYTNIERGNFQTILSLASSSLSDVALLMPEGSAIALNQGDGATLSLQVKRIGIVPAYTTLGAWILYVLLLHRIFNAVRCKELTFGGSTERGFFLFAATVPLLTMNVLRTVMPELETAMLARSVSINMHPIDYTFSVASLLGSYFSWAVFTLAVRRMNFTEDPQKDFAGFVNK